MFPSSDVSELLIAPFPRLAHEIGFVHEHTGDGDIVFQWQQAPKPEEDPPAGYAWAKRYDAVSMQIIWELVPDLSIPDFPTQKPKDGYEWVLDGRTRRYIQQRVPDQTPKTYQEYVVKLMTEGKHEEAQQVLDMWRGLGPGEKVELAMRLAGTPGDYVTYWALLHGGQAAVGWGPGVRRIPFAEMLENAMQDAGLFRAVPELNPPGEEPYVPGPEEQPPVPPEEPPIEPPIEPPDDPGPGGIREDTFVDPRTYGGVPRNFDQTLDRVQRGIHGDPFADGGHPDDGLVDTSVRAQFPVQLSLTKKLTPLNVGVLNRPVVRTGYQSPFSQTPITEDAGTPDDDNDDRLEVVMNKYLNQRGPRG